MNRGKNNSKSVGIGRMFAWQSRAVSQGCAIMALGFLSVYCTDTLNIEPAIIGTLLVLSKLFDGVTDVIAGYVVDRTDTRWGKGRPYEFCIVGMWVCTWLLFTCSPSWSTVVKCIWIFIMYALVNSIFSTFLNANNTVYMVRAFRYQEQYVAISSYGSIISMLGVVVFNIAFPICMAEIATSAAGWSRLIALFAVPLSAIGVLRFIFIKETNNIDVKSETGGKDKVKLKDVFTVLKSNPYIYIIALIAFICNFVTNMGVNVYYFKYVAKNIALFSIVSAVQILAIPMVIVFPALIKKFSTSKVILAGCLCSAFGYALNYFAGENVILLGTAAVLYGIGGVPISMLLNLMIIECADYNEWKGWKRMEGTLASVSSFTTKVGASIGAGVLGILLSMSGYVGDADLIPDSAVHMIRNLFSVIPAFLWLVVAASLLLYKLDKMMPQIRKENEERRIAIEQGRKA